MKGVLQVIAPLGLLFQLVRIDATDNYLWDLDADPYETNNLYGDASVASIQSTLTSYFQTAVEESGTCDDDEIIQTEAEVAAFSGCGGICPYDNNTYSMDIEQKYSYESAPNIIFMLADDWGYNDYGGKSTYMGWTTPTIDSIVEDGVTLTNYFTHFYCIPSRGALLTGRTANRLGMMESTGYWCSLPLSEVTIAQEMKSAGYRTYMIGKWHMGFTSLARTPEYRGFDYFYGYYTGEIDYYSKGSSLGFAGYTFLDLQTNGSLVSDEDETDVTLHSAYLFQDKAESIIAYHAKHFSSTPMFLLYSLQLVHSPYDAPSTYSDRCQVDGDDDDLEAYCAYNLMLDEVVANTTCLLATTGLADNSVIVLTSDNGGVSTFSGNSYPYLGHKYDLTRGGVSANAFIYSTLLPTAMRGASYGGLMHVSDWLPTLMSIATNGEWSGSYSGATLDGVNQWDAIIGNLSSPRSLIVHYAAVRDTTMGSVQYGNYKLDIGITLPDEETPTQVTDAGGESYSVCDAQTALSASSFSMTFMGVTVLSSTTLFSSWGLVLATPLIIFTLYRIMKGREKDQYQPIADPFDDELEHET